MLDLLVFVLIIAGGKEVVLAKWIKTGEIDSVLLLLLLLLTEMSCMSWEEALGCVLRRMALVSLHELHGLLCMLGPLVFNIIVARQEGVFPEWIEMSESEIVQLCGERLVRVKGVIIS